MAHRTVRPNEILPHGIRMHHGNLAESGVPALLAGPVQQGQIEQAVYNSPSPGILLQIVPCPDKTPHRIEPSRQDCGRMHGNPSGIRISCQPVIRHRRRHEHKSHIMMQPVEILKALLHLLLGNPGNPGITLLSCILVQKPQDAAPEAVCPPV